MTQPPTDELAQWRWQADRRWAAARQMLVTSTVPEEIAGENRHQALERYLKWFLICRGWKLRKTHDLMELIEEAESHDSSLGSFAELCARVNGYFIEERYPHVGLTFPERNQLEKDFAEAEQLIKLLTAGH
ncbi:MAG: HEPN domain-containing protein [Verrucomicrobiae bacterium]|nr:HEPN domain-containing protein [Verrucomicrobiae bacterium]